MSNLICFFKDHPHWGMATSLSAVLQTFIETSTPVLQYVGLLTGVAIGLVTLYLKLKDLLKKRV